MSAVVSCTPEFPEVEKIPRGNQIRHPHPYGFLFQGWEIFWPKDGPWEEAGWYDFLPDKDKITLYSVSFANETCQVEWNKNGWIYSTQFRSSSRRKKSKGCKKGQLNCGNDKGDKRDNILAQANSELTTAKKSSELITKRSLPTSVAKDASKSEHYVTDTLDMTREELLSSLPLKIKDMFSECVWAKWNESYYPALLLSPFDIAGKDSALKEWVKSYSSCRDKGTMSQLPHLLYWYEKGWSKYKEFKAFSIVGGDDIISYEEGIRQHWDRPYNNKLENPVENGLLTYKEDKVLSGIKMMKKDAILPKECRGG